MKLITRASRSAFFVLCTGVLAACGGGGSFVGDTTDAGDTPPALTLNLSAPDIKTLRLDWSAMASATEYRVMGSPDGVQTFSRIASVSAGTLHHEWTVFLPDQLNARYLISACNANGCVDSAPVTVGGAVLNAGIGYFKASNQGKLFGSSIALSADGGTMAIGVIADDSAATGVNGNPDDASAAASGAVYVFVRSALGWTRQAYIKPDNTTAYDEFGQVVSLSANGQRLAVSTTRRQTADGAVYLFERNGTDWTQQVELSPPTTGQNARFGHALALAGDGTTLVVAERDSATLRAAVHVYSHTPSGWSAVPTTLFAPGPLDTSFRFGQAVAIDGDGNTLVVGATSQRPTPSAPNTGAVYAYTRSSGAWSLPTRLLASNAGVGDAFGDGLALSADGQTLAVGATYEASPSTGVNGPDGDGMRNSGAVYVFTQTGGNWSQQAYIKASNTHELNYFGCAVALSADGNVLAIGAYLESGSDLGLGGTGADNSARARSHSGAAYVFHRNAANWRQTAYVKASQADENDSFGQHLALSGDGQTLAVVAPGEDSISTGIGGDALDNSGSNNGAVYLY